MTIARLIAGHDRPMISCGIDTDVRDAVALLARERIGALPVLDGTAVAGIFSERDVVQRLAEQGPMLLDQPVARVMTAPAITVTPHTAVLEALGLMTRRRIRHLPVLEGGRMIAFISIGDLVKYRMDRIQHEAEAMREYIQTA